MHDLEPDESTCPICSSGDLFKFNACAFDVKNSVVSIIECNSCCFAWQYPFKRTENQSIDWYDNAYLDEGKTESQYFNPFQKTKIANLEFEFINKLPVKKKTLLDIGAGACIFAQIAASNDWLVTAIDPAMDTNFTPSNPNIKSIRGTVDQLPAQELFDIVTLWDVIEHVQNPLQLLHNVKKHLKKDGWIVLETGNYISADRIKGGLDHWIYQIDHRWYFSPTSIKSILMKAGFSEFKFSDKVLRPGWHGQSEYTGPSKLGLIKSIAKDPLNIKNHLNGYLRLAKVKRLEMSGLSIFTVAAR